MKLRRLRTCFPCRPWLKPLLGLAMGLAASATQATSAAAGTPLNLGTVAWIGYAPIYVAVGKGFFAAQGLDVNLVNFGDPAALAPAVYSGQVDAGTETYDQVIGTNAKGWNMKVVMPIDYSAGADAMVAASAISSVSQIKGHKVAYAELTPSDFLLAYALKQSGLSKKDIISVNVTAEAVPGVMEGGSADVGVTYEPSVSGILAAGGGKKFHVLFSSKQTPGLITDVFVVKAKTIKRDPAMITAFIKGFVQGEAYIQAHPEDAFAIIGKALGESAAEAKAQYAGVINPPLSEMPMVLAKSDKLPSFWVSGPIIGEVLKSEGQITAMPSIAETYDAQFVNALAGAR